MTDYRSWFDDAVSAQRPHALSGAGENRRAIMRDELVGAVVRRRRRRTATRIGLAAAAALLVASGAAFWLTDRGSGPAPRQHQVADAAELRLEHADLTIVRGPSASVASWIVRDRPIAAGIVIDDDGLLQCLRDADREATLMRSSDRLVLLPDPVAGE